MKYLIFPSRRVFFARKLDCRTRVSRMLPALLGILICAPTLRAQQTDTPSGMDPQTAQELLMRIDRLEARLKESEARQVESDARIKELELILLKDPAASPSSTHPREAQFPRTFDGDNQYRGPGDTTRPRRDRSARGYRRRDRDPTSEPHDRRREAQAHQGQQGSSRGSASH